MFKFDFDVEDDSVDQMQGGSQEVSSSAPDDRPFKEHSLEELIQTLPDDISYSSVQVGTHNIPRRDLFDVRLQLMASEAQNDNPTDKDKEDQAAIEFASRPSDLVPRVYEGGMKTWECSLDLAGYVSDEGVRGKRILELGCGTAIPSLAILQKLLNEDPPIFHLQDYNSSVLEFVTLPNVILSVPEEDEEEAEIPEQPPVTHDPHAFNITEPGDLSFTPALRSAFLDSLAAHHIELRFFSGPWDGFNPATPYDLVLTSETIYQPTSVPSLVRLLRDASGSSGKCLVAAKMVYFGVGGGIREFEQVLEKGGGSAKCIWEQREGVGRSIMQVTYEFRNN
ncbi:hypothetical protein B0J17DRAFT_696614 [Rhizoctonia solani]|nr:hypothetical protein B0J17DRAFT_696614 [Rhizoctonia solani]